jgi:hypothetical protein
MASNDPHFYPLVPGIKPTNCYSDHIRFKATENMWEMWHIYHAYTNFLLYCRFSYYIVKHSCLYMELNRILHERFLDNGKRMRSSSNITAISLVSLVG